MGLDALVASTPRRLGRHDAGPRRLPGGQYRLAALPRRPARHPPCTPPVGTPPVGMPLPSRHRRHATVGTALAARDGTPLPAGIPGHAETDAFSRGTATGS
ncbi:hypothetical protein AB0J38_30530 [Streptomyces sp. NPDC050095]|uniref:hypothetical protein n=1 Tax=unclassified Streptomyces TaxID=2593676 RepID=UPI003418CE1D